MEGKTWLSDQTDQWKGKSYDTQVSHVYLSPGKAEHDIHDHVVSTRSQGRLSMITQILKGKGGYFT